MGETTQPIAQCKSAHPFLVMLATIGGLTVLGMVAFFFAVFWALRSGEPIPIAAEGPQVGVVDIKGVISEAEPVLKSLREFRRDKDIVAVVLRVDSPGGAVGASQEIYDEVRRVDKDKPVVASLATVAASGGFYAAVGARHIVSDPGTVTGSIGVIMQIPNLGPLLEKVGIGTTIVKAGRFKDMGSMTRTLTPDERSLLEGVLEDVHQQFIDAVAESRGLPREKVAAVADGRIMTGKQAMTLGLVDELGNFSVAADRAVDLAKAKGEPVLVYPKRPPLSLLREVFEEGAQGVSHIVKSILVSPPAAPLSY